MVIRTNNVNTDSLLFENIDPVGSAYGVYLCKDLICNYYIALKYGDYEGLTILIDTNGKIEKFSGGLPYIDYENHILISEYYSDISGFTMFDLENHKLLLDIEVEEQIQAFYHYKQEYFVSVIDFATNTESLKKIDIKNTTPPHFRFARPSPHARCPIV